LPVSCSYKCRRNAPEATIPDTSLVVAIAKEVSARPFLASAELCKRFGISLGELKIIYAAIKASPEARETFKSSPFFYLIKVLEKLSREPSRTLQILGSEDLQQPFETLELFISGSCNVNCSFCYRRDRDYGDQRILSSAEFVSIIHEFADLQGKVIDVSGGLEPLLSPAIYDVLETSLERGLQTNLYTIGNALHSPRLLPLLTRLSQIRISFTAHDRESYRRMMGIDQFERVTKNIRDLVKAKIRARSSVRIGTSYVVTPENFKDIPEAIELAVDFGVEFFDLRSVAVSASGDFTTAQRIELRDILAAVKHRQSVGAFGPLRISIADTFNIITDPDSDPMLLLEGDLVDRLIHYRVTITPAGKVFPLNILGQPTHEDERFLVGRVGSDKSLHAAMADRRRIPMPSELLLAHDKSLILALSKLKNDMSFGIGIEENLFAA